MFCSSHFFNVDVLIELIIGINCFYEVTFLHVINQKTHSSVFSLMMLNLRRTGLIFSLENHTFISDYFSFLFHFWKQYVWLVEMSGLAGLPVVS